LIEDQYAGQHLDCRGQEVDLEMGMVEVNKLRSGPGGAAACKIRKMLITAALLQYLTNINEVYFSGLTTVYSFIFVSSKGPVS
jgi:hypothetical protein